LGTDSIHTSNIRDHTYSGKHTLAMNLLEKECALDAGQSLLANVPTTLALNTIYIFSCKKHELEHIYGKQVNVFPYIKTRRLCVLLHYLNYHWYNSTVKINRLIN